MQKGILSGAVAAAMLLAPLARAEVPGVATDIAPVQSLVAQVMGDLGRPDLILPPGASPHGYALRPSEARALARADLVIWVGPALTPWLADTIATLPEHARTVALLDVAETEVLPYRNEATFAEPVAGHEGDHDHSPVDPHAWLDPQNMMVWAGAIGAALAEADPEHAAIYRANAERATTRLMALKTRTYDRLTPVRDLPYVVFHDAYQYFERRFDMPAAGAISLGNGTDPGAARVTEIRDLIAAEGVRCIATEPQFNPALVGAVSDGIEVRTTVLDPVGTGIAPGPDFYDALIGGLADGLLACE